MQPGDLSLFPLPRYRFSTCSLGLNLLLTMYIFFFFFLYLPAAVSADPVRGPSPRLLRRRQTKGQNSCRKTPRRRPNMKEKDTEATVAILQVHSPPLLLLRRSRNDAKKKHDIAIFEFMCEEEEVRFNRTSQALPALKKSFGRTSITLRCLCIKRALSARDLPRVPGVLGGLLS